MTEIELKQIKMKKTIFIVLFFALNIMNGFLVTTTIFNKNISPYGWNWFMVTNFILGDLGFMTIIFALSTLIFKKDKGRFTFLMIATIIMSIICIAMTIFFYQYGMFFAFTNLQALNNPTGGQAFDFMFAVMGILLLNAQYLALLPGVVAIVLIIMFKKKGGRHFYNTSIVGANKSRFFLGISLSIIGFLLMINAQSAYKYEIEETWYQDNQDVLYGIQTVGMYNFYVYDFYAHYIAHIDEINEEKMNTIKGYLDAFKNELRSNEIDGLVYGNNQDVRGVYDGMNFILIQAESLNNFTLGLHVNGKEITPNLNRLVENGTYFNNFYATVGMGNTSDVEFAVMTGLYPKGGELMAYSYADGYYETLPKDFNNNNYYTVSTHGNTSLFYNRRFVHKATYGFDDHLGIEDLDASDGLIHHWISDLSLLKQTIDIVAAQDKPTFAFPILISCHTPYADDINMKKVLDTLGFSLEEDIMNPFVRGYLEHVFYVDYAIGEAIAYLELMGLKDNTVIAVYGDHGAGINETHIYENLSVMTNEVNPFALELYDLFNVRNKFAYRKISQEIPLIFYELSDEKKIEPQTIPLVRGEVDLYRTISNLFGLDSVYYFGVDAFSHEPTFIYNPRNMDTFTDAFMLSITSLEAYREDGLEISMAEIRRLNDIVRNTKDRNDKILLYIRYRKE